MNKPKILVFDIETAQIRFSPPKREPVARYRAEPLRGADVLPGRPRARDRKGWEPQAAQFSEQETASPPPVSIWPRASRMDLAVLGLSERASTSQVHAAFRTLAAQLHPDKPGGDKLEFARLSEAYHRLTG